MLRRASPTTIKKQVIILNDFGNWVQHHKWVDAEWENPFTGLTYSETTVNFDNPAPPDIVEPQNSILISMSSA